MNRNVLPAIFCSAALGSFPTAYGALDTTLFSWRIPITVSGYAGESELENFPVLVALEANQPAGFNYAHCALDGSDLRFVDEDGNILPHEEVASIRAMLQDWAKEAGDPSVVMDIHCPWLRGSWLEEDNSNEYIYTVGIKAIEPAQRRFCEAVGREIALALREVLDGKTNEKENAK